MRFLVVTDLHYAKKETSLDREYALSAGKLRRIIADRAAGCDFIVDLGDSTEDCDGVPQTALLEEIAALLRGSGLPVYGVIGNHDTSLPDETTCRILGMPGRYYSFDTPEYTCVVLDGNRNTPDADRPDGEIRWDETYLDETQLVWLEQKLDAAEKPVLVFCHELFLLHTYENAADGHVLRNRDRAISLFERSGKVRGVFCGHYHPGEFISYHGIPYMTFSALVLKKEDTCAVVTIEDGAVTVDGFGLEPSRTYALR